VANVLTRDNIRSADRRNYRKALRINERPEKTLILQISGGIFMYFATETLPYKKPYSLPPFVLAFEDFGTPPVLISTHLPTLGIAGYDSGYGGYVITSYGSHGSQREGVEVNYFTAFFFGEANISAYVLNDKLRKNPAAKVV
jgi:hypothetical protein